MNVLVQTKKLCKEYGDFEILKGGIGIMSTIKKELAAKLLKATTGIANTSTTVTPTFLFSEPKLPTSLLKK